MLVIPFSMAWAFGLIVGDRRQGVAVLAVMALLLGISIALITWAEMAGPGSAPAAAGGAMEGKEVRFGTAALGALRAPRPPAPRPAPSTPCTTRSPPPAAASRCST